MERRFAMELFSESREIAEMLKYEMRMRPNKNPPRGRNL
jgi:hypothetical protein